MGAMAPPGTHRTLAAAYRIGRAAVPVRRSGTRACPARYRRRRTGRVPRPGRPCAPCRPGPPHPPRRRRGLPRSAGRLRPRPRRASAATAGHAGTYHARYAALGSPAPAGGAEGRLAWLWDQGHKDAAALGAPIAGPAASELIAVIEELNAPGPFLALSHGDAESNNILVRESGPADARLIDFEAAAAPRPYRRGLPARSRSGWISVGRPGAAGLADSTAVPGPGRAERAGRPALRIRPGSSLHVLGALRLRRFAVLDTRAPGDHSRLQLVETWNPPPGPPKPTAPCPAWQARVRRTADVLRRRWPDADLDLTDWATFPPFAAPLRMRPAFPGASVPAD